MLVTLSCCGDVFQRKGLEDLSGSRGKMNREKYRDPRWKPARVLRISYWGDGSPSNRTMTLSTQLRQHRSGFRTILNVLEWPNQRPDLNPFKLLWRDLKIAVQRRSHPTWQSLRGSVCQACSVIPKKTQGCTRCQRCFKTVLSKWVWILM
jgi:hypothetical protein